MIRREKQAFKQLRRAAFTLMEMLVVVAIIVALAGMGGFFFMEQLENAKVKTASVQCKTLTQACEAYMMDHQSQVPGSLQELKQPTPQGGPYLKEDSPVVDPWNQPYSIEKLGTGEVRVTSPGRPGKGAPVK